MRLVREAGEGGLIFFFFFLNFNVGDLLLTCLALSLILASHHMH